MISNKTNLILCGIIALIAIVGALALRSAHEDIEGYKSINTALRNSLQSEKNAHGQTLVQKNAAEASLSLMKESFGKEMAAVKKEFGIKEKHLKSLIQANTVTVVEGEGRVDTVYKEVDGEESWYLEDYDIQKWHTLHLTVDQGGFYDYDLEIRDSITFAVGMSRPKWYKKLEFVVSGKNENPDAKITGLNSITVSDVRPLWLTVGPSLQASLVEGEVKYILGVSIQAPLIQIRRPWKKR